jgi:hypothetical protein
MYTSGNVFFSFSPLQFSNIDVFDSFCRNKSLMSKNPRKNIDYRALWEHPELMIKAPALRVMVRAAARERFLKAQNDPTLLDISCTIKANSSRFPMGRRRLHSLGRSRKSRSLSGASRPGCLGQHKIIPVSEVEITREGYKRSGQST